MPISGFHMLTRDTCWNTLVPTYFNMLIIHMNIYHTIIYTHGGGEEGSAESHNKNKMEFSSWLGNDHDFNTKRLLGVLSKRDRTTRVAAGSRVTAAWIVLRNQPCLAFNEHPEAMCIQFLDKAEKGPRRINTWQNKLHMWPKDYLMVHSLVPASWEGKAEL